MSFIRLLDQNAKTSEVNSTDPLPSCMQPASIPAMCGPQQLVMDEIKRNLLGLGHVESEQKAEFFPTCHDYKKRIDEQWDWYCH